MNKKIQLQDATGTNNLFPNANMGGIDTNNILASFDYANSTQTYVATQDCVFFGVGCFGRNDSYGVFIDNVPLSTFAISSVASKPESAMFYLKKGQTLKFKSEGTAGYGNGFKIFGIKY